MDRDKFDALLPYVTSDLAAIISQKEKLSEIDALTKLYKSELYSMLEQEETKLWHYSTEMLYSLFSEEQQTGTITYPDV